MHDKRIFILSDIGCGPPFRGNRKRMRRLLAQIKSLGYEIYFAGVRMSAGEKESLKEYADHWVADFYVQMSTGEKLIKRLRKRGLFPKKKNSLKLDEQLNVASADCLFDPAWSEKVRAIQEKYQFKRVLVPYIYNSKFLELLSGAPIRIIDTHDVFTNRNKVLKSIGVDHYWFSVSEDEERRALNRASHVLAIQEEEAGYFRQIVSEHVHVARVKHITDTSHVMEDIPHQKQFGFIGSDNPLSLDSFLWFSEEVLPVIKKKFPEASCLVAGSVCNNLPESNLYKKLGRVENVDDFYVLCSFTINPVRAGTGLKIKTIESLEHYRPVITSSEGARGLNEFIGSGITICSSKEQYIEAVYRNFRNESPAPVMHSIHKNLLEMNRISIANLKRALAPDIK
jgi:hypothetical protein